ncbi:MAG TPA: PEGA domain-containing protein, partial [Usitatibacter sp.]|nr:PEGA domain-containing protein [Usitatibacter sp.]
PEAGKPAEPAKAAEPAKPELRPESHVLAPAPTRAQIPPAAPASARTEPAAANAAAKPGEPPRTDAESAKPALPPATLVFAVQPWGEIFVNGKSRGVTPPMKALKLDPGKYKVEVRNTTFAPHVENLELKARDEVTVRYKFQ